MSFGPEPDRRFCTERQAYHEKLDPDLLVFLDIGGPTGPDDLAALLDCPEIHLSGGHTRVFQRLLKENGLLVALADWAQNGGILIGTSAGAILMTPSVALYALLSGKDPKAVRGAEALGLVPCEFFPHF